MFKETLSFCAVTPKSVTTLIFALLASSLDVCKFVILSVLVEMFVVLELTWVVKLSTLELLAFSFKAFFKSVWLFKSPVIFPHWAEVISIFPSPNKLSLLSVLIFVPLINVSCFLFNSVESCVWLTLSFQELINVSVIVSRIALLVWVCLAVVFD